MERKYKILVAAAILVVLVVIGEGVMILNLQKNMSRLISPGNEGTNSSASNETSQAAKQNAPDYLVKAKQDELGALHDVGGTIVSFSDNQVGVQASVPDLAKLKDLTADDLNKPVDSFPQMEKTFKVTFNDQTNFSVKKPADFMVGENIIIFTDDLIYKTDTLTAKKVLYPAPPKDNNKLNFIGGKIKEIGNNFLTVETTTLKSADSSAAQPPAGKEYKVLTDSNTAFALKAAKAGDMIVAFSPDQLADKSEFTAVKIIFPKALTTSNQK